ncbi:MAG: ATP synthase F1 subunit delta [Phycisphaeraceae bacterium]|nr:ATP synthase F1 subunit delta [Phycisphaeraceae bacterium]
MGNANPSNTTTAIDRTYAAALLQMADAEGRLDEVADEVNQLAQLLRDNESLHKLLACRTLTVGEMQSVLERLFAGRVSDLVYRFLQVVNRKSRLGELAGFLDAFNVLLDRKRGILEVDLFTASQLDRSAVDRIAGELGRKLSKQVVVHQSVESTLIGGLKLRIGDQLIDASVATQLEQMKQKLIEQGREKARLATATG